MISKITINGVIDRKEGKLRIMDSKSFVRSLKNFSENEVEIIIVPRPKFRSQAQLGYYWSAIVPACKKGFEELGYQFTKEETHRQLADLFLFVEESHKVTGETIKKHLSLSDAAQQVNQKIMKDYIDRIIQFAGEHLEIKIPSPKRGNIYNDY